MVNVDEPEHPRNKNKIITVKEIKERFFTRKAFSIRAKSFTVSVGLNRKLSIILENGKKEWREKIEFENSLSFSIDFVKFYC